MRASFNSRFSYLFLLCTKVSLEFTIWTIGINRSECILFMICIYTFCTSIFHLCKSIFHLCKSIFYLCKSIFHLCKSIFYLCKSIFHLCKSIFQLCKSIFQLCKSIFYLCKSIFALCKSNLHMCESNSFDHYWVNQILHVIDTQNFLNEIIQKNIFKHKNIIIWLETNCSQILNAIVYKMGRNIYISWIECILIVLSQLFR